jgi:type 1 fimbria pilin
MRRILATMVATSALLVFASPPAFAATSGASISVSPSAVAPGGTVHISGTVPVADCPRSDDATIAGDSSLFPPDGFGPSASRDAQGGFALDYSVPTTTPSGTYDVGMRCGGGNPGASARITVTAVPIGAPQTGAGGTAGRSAWPRLVLGLASLSLAGLMLVLRRKLARAHV